MKDSAHGLPLCLSLIPRLTVYESNSNSFRHPDSDKRSTSYSFYPNFVRSYHTIAVREHVYGLLMQSFFF